MISFKTIKKMGGDLVPSHITVSGNLYIPASIGGVELLFSGEDIFVRQIRGKLRSRYVSIGKDNVREFFADTEDMTYPVILKKTGPKEFKLLFGEENDDADE